MAAVDGLTKAVDALTKAIDALTKTIANAQLKPQRESLTADSQGTDQCVFPSSQSDVDLGSGRDIKTKSDANDKEEETIESESSSPKETPSSPMPDCALSADISFVPCPPSGPNPVSVTNKPPSNGFCFALVFIDCSFGGDQPLRFDNCIIDCVTFTDCHFEGTQFANSVLKDMKVADIVFSDSWWMNRGFTQNFITIGREQDDTKIFDGKREGLNDEIPAELQDSEYKNRRFREQDLGGYQQAGSWQR